MKRKSLWRSAAILIALSAASCSAPHALAVKLAPVFPSRTSLQPIPQSVHPNISRNANDTGTPAVEGQGVSAGQQAASNAEGTEQGQMPAASSSPNSSLAGLWWGLMVVILTLAFLIWLARLLRASEKQNKKGL